MESIFDWSVILSIVGVLVIVTNIVVQVLKNGKIVALGDLHSGEVVELVDTTASRRAEIL